MVSGNSDSNLCKCDPTQPLPENNHCKVDDIKSPMIETARQSEKDSKRSGSSSRSIKSKEKTSRSSCTNRKSLI